MGDINLISSSYALTKQGVFYVAIAVVVLLAIAILLSAIVMIHHLWSDRDRRRNRERFEGAASFLAPFLITTDEELSASVARARAKYGDRAVGLVLRRARFDLKGEVAGKIADCLLEMGAVDELIRETKSRRDWRRVGGARGLGECGGEKTRAVLMDLAMNDPIGDVRRAAREGLLAEGHPQATQVAIDSFLQDLPRRAGWRRSFYARLASVSSGDLLDLIRSRQLSSGEEKLALEALGDAGATAALPLAIAATRSREPELRATGIRVAGKLGADSEFPLILRSLEDDAWFVRAAGARALEWMLGSRRIAPLDRDVQGYATKLLGARLDDGSWWVRANAARALARAGEEGVSVLFRAAEGTDRYARDAALAALAMANLDSARTMRLRQLAGAGGATEAAATRAAALRAREVPA